MELGGAHSGSRVIQRNNTTSSASSASPPSPVVDHTGEMSAPRARMRTKRKQALDLSTSFVFKEGPPGSAQVLIMTRLLFILFTAGLLFLGCESEPDTTAADTTAGFDTQISGSDTHSGSDTTSPSDTQAPDTTVADTGSELPPQDTGTAQDTQPPEDTAAPVALDVLLEGLRGDLDGTMQAQSEAAGWPAPVDNGYLFVSTDPTLNQVAGDHDSWTGQAMTVESEFAWLVLDVADGSRYKFTDQTRWVADPWSRAYHWDENGVMSQVPPTDAHLERFFNVTDGTVVPRRVRVYVPAEAATHVLYVHDGQNLFNPNATWGGWQLDDSAPAGMLLVGIDNTGGGRMEEYTHVVDEIRDRDGNVTYVGGGGADDYAAFIQNTVRPLVEAHYGEPDKVGTMGSSLGGLVAFHIADRYPGEYDFAASLSGTMGWGSFYLNNETMIERYDAAGKRSTELYLDSGGNVSGTCVDSDGDGIEDDADDSDNYCTNKQLEAVLYADGYTADVDVWHWWEEDAPHNEAAWAARVFRPLDIFAGL